jgi:hypothetical protein
MFDLSSLTDHLSKIVAETEMITMDNDHIGDNGNPGRLRLQLND